MKERLVQITFWTFVLLVLAFAQVSYSLTYHVEIQNLDPTQPLTPPVVAIHQPGYEMYAVDGQASMGLEELAEDGKTETLLMEAMDSMHTHHAMVAGNGPSFSSFKFIVDAMPGDRLSFAAMFAKTNDVFVGVNGLVLPGGSNAVEQDLMAYDAGTEENTGLVEHIPAYGNAEVGPDENNPIMVINQYTIMNDPDQGQIEYSWPPAAKIVVTPMPNAVEYEIRIVGESEGQPLTPPVIALHNAQSSLFMLGEPASEGLELLAEEGQTGTLITEWTGNMDVWIVKTAGDGPGFEHSTTIWGQPGQQLTIATMLARTNDVFTGVMGLTLPEAGELLRHDANAYDAGTEMNTGLMEHIPFYGNSGGPEEDGSISEIMMYSVVDDPEGMLDYEWPPVAFIEVMGTEPMSSVPAWDLY